MPEIKLNLPVVMRSLDDIKAAQTEIERARVEWERLSSVKVEPGKYYRYSISGNTWMATHRAGGVDGCHSILILPAMKAYKVGDTNTLYDADLQSGFVREVRIEVTPL